MRDFIYDLKRTLSGKFTIGSIVAIILISALLGYSLTANTSSNSGPSISTNWSYTYGNGTYNVSIYAFNSNGQPVSTLPLYLEHNNSITNLTTNSAGFAEFTVHSNSSYVNLNYSLARSGSSLTGFINPVPMNNVYINNSKYQFQNVKISLTQITSPGTTNSHELLMYYSPNFQNFTSYKVYIYYNVVNLTNGFTPASINNMTFYKEVTINKVGTMIIDPNVQNLSARQGITVSLFSANNSTAIQLESSTYVPQNIISTLGTATTVFDVFSAIFGILIIPILATLSAYFYFGKDRASGVLESVITRPVTKGRIIVSRYVANVGSLVFAFAVGTAVFDIFLYRATGANLSFYYAGTLIWTYFVEIAAFTGFIYLVSQFVKSQGGILGIAIVLFLVLGFMWSGIITPLIFTYVFHVTSGTNAYLQYSVFMDAINPGSYGVLMVFFISHLSTLGATVDPAKFGITGVSMTVLGLVWIIVPILIAFVIGRRRD